MADEVRYVVDNTAVYEYLQKMFSAYLGWEDHEKYKNLYYLNKEMLIRVDKLVEGMKIQLEQSNRLIENTQTMISQTDNLTKIVHQQTEYLIEKTEEVKSEVSKGTEVASTNFILQTAGKLFTQLGLIKSQDIRIEQQFFKAINRIIKINQKFDKLNTEIEDSYKLDVKRIGKHILAIEEQFKNKIEKRLRSLHTNFFQSVKSSMEEIGAIRKVLFERNFSSASEKVNGFIQQRKQFHDTVSKIRIEEVKTPNQTFAVPVTVAISKTDSNYQKVYAGTEVQDIIDPSVKFRLEDQDWFNTYKDASINYEASIDWRDMSEDEKKQILDEFTVLKQEGFINDEFTEAFRDALSLHPPRVPEKVRTIVN